MIYLISDLHLTDSDAALNHRFEVFTERLRPNDDLYILGDLFEYWLGDDAVAFLGHSTTRQRLANLSANGVGLYFLSGNRDFLVGANFLAECGMKKLDPEHILQVGERRLLLMHGDSLCTDDIAHQKFRAMVLDPVWQDMFLSKTIDERDAMARLARYRSNDGKTTKSAEIMDVTATAVNDVMEQHSVTLLIHGHTHRPAVHQLKDSGATRHRVVLGDWDTAESVITLSEERLTLRFRGQDHTLAL